MTLTDQLASLGMLHARGILTDDEFARAKRRVIDDYRDEATPRPGTPTPVPAPPVPTLNPVVPGVGLALGAAAAGAGAGAGMGGGLFGG